MGIDLTKSINLKHVTIGSILTTIILIAGSIGALQVLKSCGHETLAQPALEDHAVRFESLHKALIDTDKDHGDRLCKVEKKQRRYESLFFAQYSDEDIKRLDKRAREIEKRDTLFQ